MHDKKRKLVTGKKDLPGQGTHEHDMCPSCGKALCCSNDGVPYWNHNHSLTTTLADGARFSYIKVKST